MSGALAHDQAVRLRAAVEHVLDDADSHTLGTGPRETLLRLVDVLEAGPEAVVFPSDARLSTQQVADLLGVSRMTVVRLIDTGELPADGGGVHRRVRASEVAHYRQDRARRRRMALDGLAAEIGPDTPADSVIRTR